MLVEFLVFIIIAVTVLVLFDAAAARWGVDSRPESGDPRGSMVGLSTH